MRTPAAGWVVIDVSKEHVAFTFMGSRLRKDAILHGLDLKPMKMKANRSFETSETTIFRGSKVHDDEILEGDMMLRNVANYYFRGSRAFRNCILHRHWPLTMKANRSFETSEVQEFKGPRWWNSWKWHDPSKRRNGLPSDAVTSPNTRIFDFAVRTTKLAFSNEFRNNNSNTQITLLLIISSREGNHIRNPIAVVWHTKPS